MFARVPDMSAEDPESSGIEQQPGDEEQQVEIGVHLVHALLPVGHIVVTLCGGDVQGLPQSRRIQSHSIRQTQMA